MFIPREIKKQIKKHSIKITTEKDNIILTIGEILIHKKLSGYTNLSGVEWLYYSNYLDNQTAEKVFNYVIKKYLNK